MGIDYVVALDCAAKQELSIEGLVDMVKARSRAETILAIARQNGDQRSPRDLTFTVAMNRDGAIEQHEVSVQALLDRAAPLDANRGGCASCPANGERERGYGCYGSISYPIEADTERWLLSRLPDDLGGDDPAGFLFRRALADFAWDGAQAAHMRAQGDTFFRLREAPQRRWPGGVVVTADQIFHMMFHVGHLGAGHSKMLCVFFGLISFGDDDDDDGDDEPRASSVEIESGNAEQMIDFLNSLGFAQSEGLDVLVDG